MSEPRDPGLDPVEVQKRLDELRRIYVAETRQEHEARLARDVPRPRQITSADPEFAAAVQQRLGELHALCELTRYLHAARATADEADRADEAEREG